MEKKSLSPYYGIKKESNYKGLKVFRPLIDIKKQDLQSYCDLKNIPYAIDSSNDKDVYERTQDAAVNIPAGFEGGALDFASSPLSWIIFHLTYSLKTIGTIVLIGCTLFLMVLNRRAIIKYQKENKNN